MSKKLNARSSMMTEGDKRAPNRAMLRAVGFKDGDFQKPIVGIASAWSEITPCNYHLNELAERTKRGITAAGGMGQTFGTITVSDGIAMGHEGMKFSLASREVIADSVETVSSAQRFDGLVVIGGCDKNMPGALMGIGRLNIPAAARRSPRPDARRAATRRARRPARRGRWRQGREPRCQPQAASRARSSRSAAPPRGDWCRP
ncbi:MAG: dihydroxy-acid dehydratase, partial [bacterium]